MLHKVGQLHCLTTKKPQRRRPSQTRIPFMGRPRANQLCKLSLLHFSTEAEQEQQPICLLVTTKVLY